MCERLTANGGGSCGGLAMGRLWGAEGERLSMSWNRNRRSPHMEKQHEPIAMESLPHLVAPQAWLRRLADASIGGRKGVWHSGWSQRDTDPPPLGA